MKTNHASLFIKHEIVGSEDIEDTLNRAQALAVVLADAAGGDLGVEPENVHHVGLAIAQEVNKAKELLARYIEQENRANKEAA